MYIRRKVFSLLNVEGEDRYFSTTDFEVNEENEIRLFSEGEKKKRKVALKEVEDHKGIKRAILTSGITGGGSLVGGYLAKEEADKADDEGASDEEIIRRAKKHGAKVGAITGAAAAGLGGLAGGGRTALAGVVGGGILGGVGGHCAAGVNTKSRLAKRAQKEKE